MLRLGDRLETEIIVDEEAASVQIPALCIQPLVQNRSNTVSRRKPVPARSGS